MSRRRGAQRAALEALQACHTALTGATRIGLMSTVLVLAWPCLHYLAASRLLGDKAGRPDG